MGLLCPPMILRLEFKTKDELLLQPQTAEEHAEEMREYSSDSDTSSSSSSSTSSDEEEDHVTAVIPPFNCRAHLR